MEPKNHSKLFLKSKRFSSLSIKCLDFLELLYYFDSYYIKLTFILVFYFTVPDAS